jgi:hypothetical protein
MATVASNIGQPRRTIVATPPKPLETPALRSQQVRTAPIVAAAKPKTKRTRASTPRSDLCPQLSDIGRQYINISDGQPVRCGPQTQDPVGGNRYVTTMTPQDVPNARTPQAPLNSMSTASSAASSTASSTVFAAPSGYRAAWADGRLNPNRGPQTAQGQAQMEQVWTNTVPRKLITVKRVRVAQAPQIRMTASTKAMAPRVQRGTGAVKTRAVAPQQTGTLRHRYIQVGTFGVAANAQKTAARLQAVGLPVQMVNIKKGGKPLQIVVAGPFGSPAQLSAGMNAARRAGFRDAFPRN